MFRRILVVCTGNICRSPMAQSLLANTLSEKGEGVEVGSAGLAALVGHPADTMAQEFMRGRGLNIAAHRATQLTRAQVLDAELVLVMEEEQQRAIEAFVPVARGKVHRLGKWGDYDIPDPYGRSRLAYEETLDLIEQGIREWQARL